MLSSKKAFPGDDVSEVLASVIKLEPDWSALPANLPRRVRQVLRRCLEKDARRRCHDLADARIELEDDRGDTPDTAPPNVSKSRRLIAVAVGLAMLAFVAGWLWPRGTKSIGVERFTVPLDPALRIGTSELAFSPDSRELVFSALRGDEWQLYRRSHGELEAVPIPGSEGAMAPFFSPKGDWLGFITATGELKKMSWPSPGAPLIVSETANGGGFTPAGATTTQSCSVPATRSCVCPQAAVHRRQSPLRVKTLPVTLGRGSCRMAGGSFSRSPPGLAPAKLRSLLQKRASGASSKKAGKLDTSRPDTFSIFRTGLCGRRRLTQTKAKRWAMRSGWSTRSFGSMSRVMEHLPTSTETRSSSENWSG